MGRMKEISIIMDEMKVSFAVAREIYLKRIRESNPKDLVKENE